MAQPLNQRLHFRSTSQLTVPGIIKKAFFNDTQNSEFIFFNLQMLHVWQVIDMTIKPPISAQ